MLSVSQQTVATVEPKSKMRETVYYVSLILLTTQLQKGNDIQKVEICDICISRDQSNAVVGNPANRSVAEQPPVIQTLTDLENSIIGWDG